MYSFGGLCSLNTRGDSSPFNKRTYIHKNIYSVRHMADSYNKLFSYNRDNVYNDGDIYRNRDDVYYDSDNYSYGDNAYSCDRNNTGPYDIHRHRHLVRVRIGTKILLKN